MTGSTDRSSEELRVLLLQYLEGTLPKGKGQEVSDLLQTSKEARWELMALKNLMSALKTDKTLFCLEPSEIADFVATGNDPFGKIADHLEECPSCREEVQGLKSVQLADGMAPEIWDAVRGKLAEFKPEDRDFECPMPIAAYEAYPEEWSPPIAAYIPPPPDVGPEPKPSSAADEPIEPPSHPEPPERPSGILSRIFELFRRPPEEPVGPMFALSTVTWGAEVPTQLPVRLYSTERVAFVIILQDFGTPMPQERIDSLHEALKPDEQVQNRYDLMIPLQVKEALGPLGPSAHLEKAGSVLREKLDVQRVVMLTLVSEKSGIRIKAASLDAASGKLVGRTAEIVVTEQTLESALRELGYSSLDLKNSASGPQ